MKYLKNQKKLLWFIFSLGIILIVSGIALAIFYFHHEVLDKKYIVKEATSYEPKDVSLKNGEVIVIKDIEYMTKGEYKITYETKVKNTKKIELFEEESQFTITDIIGEGYILKSNKVLINNNEVKLKNGYALYGEYELTHKDNTLKITYPSYRVKNNNTIEITIKLKERTSNKKYETSKDAYYSFTPSYNNSFYSKKTTQSYIIEGKGHIILKEK